MTENTDQTTPLSDLSRFATHDIELCNRDRAAHEKHRRSLAAALGLIDAREWADMIDQVRVIRDAASERADLLEEARDALEAAGQNGAHGDDWPAIAPAIRALAAELADMRRARDAAVDRANRNGAALTAAREKYRTGLREADKKLNAMNAELKQYADGEEHPVLWSVYNRMHSRAATAEAALATYKRAIAKARGRLARYDTGPTADADNTDRAMATLAHAIRRDVEAVLPDALGDPHATGPEVLHHDTPECPFCPRPGYQLTDEHVREVHPDSAECVRCGHTPEGHRGPHGCTVLIDEDERCPCELSKGESTDPGWAEVRELPLELDGAALWAAIRDHAASDHNFWNRLERVRFGYARRGQL